MEFHLQAYISKKDEIAELKEKLKWEDVMEPGNFTISTIQILSINYIN